jgi:kynurenine formamidase
MKIQFEIESVAYFADLSKGKSIAITLLPNDKQPNHFGAPACTSETLIVGDYIGDIKRGGSCNVNVLSIIPHCNGTHTESVSHIIDELIPVYSVIKQPIFPSVVISIVPELASQTSNHYSPFMDETNLVITKEQLQQALEQYTNAQLEGLIVRTLKNEPIKKYIKYDDDNYPPYFTSNAMQYLIEREVDHLLVDFPSVDKMYDNGQLSNHRLFWKISAGEVKRNVASNINKTITEMIYVDQEIQDGIYLCNLQCPEIETDAVPSRPMLFELKEKNNAIRK